MSSSISLSTSADLDTLTSNGLSDPTELQNYMSNGRKVHNNQSQQQDKQQKPQLSKSRRHLARAHYQPPASSFTTTTLHHHKQAIPFKLTADHHQQQVAAGRPRDQLFQPASRAAEEQEGAANGGQQGPSADFYEEVDQRMSRNSFEYPEQQARYASQWLDKMDFTAAAARSACRGGGVDQDGEDWSSYSLLSSSSSLSSVNSLPASAREWGNIIGIRGFPIGASSSRRTAGAEAINQASNRQRRQRAGGDGSHSRRKRGRQRAKYNRLRFDFLELQSENEKLRAQLDETVSKFRQIFTKRNHLDLDPLRVTIASSSGGKGKRAGGEEKPAAATATTTSTGCCKCHRQSLSHSGAATGGGTGAKNQSEPNLVSGGDGGAPVVGDPPALKRRNQELEDQLRQLKEDNARLERQARDLAMERDMSKEEARNLALEPNNRMVLTLQSENLRLKEKNECLLAEFRTLKDDYAQLEAQLTALLRDGQQVGGEQNEEVSKMMVELCRLQVYQPKLEMILETERQIKQELQAKVESLESAKGLLLEQLDERERALVGERARSKKDESVEVDKLVGEIGRWQEKCYRLKEEKRDAEELLRSLKARMGAVDARHQSELERAKEMGRGETQEMQDSLARLDIERTRLGSKLQEATGRLTDAELENQRLARELAELSGRLEVAGGEKERNEATSRRLRATEERAAELASRLADSEVRAGEALDQVETSRRQAEQSKRLLEQLQQRFVLQQQALDELKENRDKELARLRVSLNFEKYNRQVALKGIEKELRASLRELEAMKYRFSRRLAHQSGGCGGGDGDATSKTATTTTTTLKNLETTAKGANRAGHQIGGDGADDSGASRSCSSAVEGIGGGGGSGGQRGNKSSASGTGPVARLISEPFRVGAGDTS